jgi:DNA-binding NtrC family response regulator
MVKHVLIVEPDLDLVKVLTKRIEHLAHVDHRARFEDARRELEKRPFDFIVANEHLGSHTGVELVQLAATAGVPVKSIVYTDTYDPVMAREIQDAGAFYETRRCSPYALAPFLRGTLPGEDRRDAAVRDRRGNFRGGRRAWDKLRHKSA